MLEKQHSEIGKRNKFNFNNDEGDEEKGLGEVKKEKRQSKLFKKKGRKRPASHRKRKKRQTEDIGEEE